MKQIWYLRVWLGESVASPGRGFDVDEEDARCFFLYVISIVTTGRPRCRYQYQKLASLAAKHIQAFSLVWRDQVVSSRCLWARPPKAQSVPSASQSENESFALFYSTIYLEFGAFNSPFIAFSLESSPFRLEVVQNARQGVFPCRRRGLIQHVNWCVDIRINISIARIFSSCTSTATYECSDNRCNHSKVDECIGTEKVLHSCIAQSVSRSQSNAALSQNGMWVVPHNRKGGCWMDDQIKKDETIIPLLLLLKQKWEECGPHKCPCNLLLRCCSSSWCWCWAVDGANPNSLGVDNPFSTQIALIAA